MVKLHSTDGFACTPERFDAALRPTTTRHPPGPRSLSVLSARRLLTLTHDEARCAAGSMYLRLRRSGAVTTCRCACVQAASQSENVHRGHFETNLCEAYWTLAPAVKGRLQQQFSRDFAAITWSLFVASRPRCMIGTSEMRERSRLASAEPLLERDLRA